MTTSILAPFAVQKFFDANGLPLVNGQLFVYSAGTSTKRASYVDSTGTTPNTNPVIANARGECNVWLLPNIGYKLVLSPANDTDPPTNPIWTVDQIVNSQLISLYGGVDTGAANAYILTFTATFTTYTDGLVLYWVPSHNNTGASTINVNGIGVISIVNPNGSALGTNQIVANQITQIVYKAGVFQLFGIGTITGVNVGTFGAENGLASAATTDLGTVAAHVAQITGNVNITSFGSTAQLAAPIYAVRFIASGLTLIYDAVNMILPGAASILVGAGDSCFAQYLGSGAWKVLDYQQAAPVFGMASGTFTGTLTGCTSTPTAIVSWIRNGSLVMMSIGAGLTATSNTTACTITGLPASLQPPASGSIYSPTVVVENNTIFELGTFDIRSANGGSLILQRAGGVSFTNVGIKGIAPCTFMYSLT